MYSPYDKEKYPERKSPRMQGYDYSTENYYFVTICTDQKKCIFGHPKKLSLFGSYALAGIQEISKHYPDCRVEKFVVMPNHVHVMIYLCGGNTKLENVIGSYKSYVSRKIHRIQPDLKVWQNSFHDHIIRNSKSFQNIWLYIDSNPANWEKDCFYVE